MKHCLAKILSWGRAVLSFVPKLIVFCLLLTGYAVFCWGVFVSPSSQFFISCTALALSVFNSVAVGALWIFYLSKQFSTHRIKVLDIKKTAAQRKPVEATAALDDDDLTDPEEAKRRAFSESLVTKMFNRTKETFNDPLN